MGISRSAHAKTGPQKARELSVYGSGKERPVAEGPLEYDPSKEIEVPRKPAGHFTTDDRTEAPHHEPITYVEKPAIEGNGATNAIRMLDSPAQSDRTTPIMYNQRYVIEIETVYEAGEVCRVELRKVRDTGRLVRKAKAEMIQGDAAILAGDVIASPHGRLRRFHRRLNFTASR